MPKTKTPATQLINLTKKARLKAHSPYSKIKIGSTVVMDDGTTFTGANIENASYGGTVCAERVAIWNAISQGSSKKIREVFVVSDTPQPWPPCGLCRQVIAEFGTPKTLITCFNLQGKKYSLTLAELLPLAFTPDHLNDKK
jgi:cytidine deaminase